MSSVNLTGWERCRALLAPFWSSVARDPRRVWARGVGVQRTLEESGARIWAASANLTARSRAPGELVGLVMPATPASIEAVAALWEAECVPVLIDPAVPREAQEEIARRLGAARVWRLDEAFQAPLDVRQVREVAVQPRSLPEAAAVKLTSGSTGEPQGVVVSARALFADTDALMRAFGLGVDDTGLVAVPLSHSYGFSVLTLPALTHGLALAFPGAENARGAARALSATFLPSVPAWYRSVLRSAAEDSLAPSLRLLVSAGAPLAPEVAREFRARFGRPIHVLYGASECGSIAFDHTGTAAERGRVGRALTGVTVELEGAGSEVPGLVCVRSPALASGYLPERPGVRLTAERFQSEDLARLHDGELELCGRQSDWINVKGRKVDPRAVEVALAGHPAVREVVVLGKPNPDSTDETVRAVIVPDRALEYLELLDWCRSRLASYQLPRSVVFVSEIPRTERGKLDRARLLALEASMRMSD
jgi:acyl-CoA synthetase (AMP-forming)/AMP-acid ligase II